MLFSFFITLGWHFHSLEAYVPAAIVRMIYPIDKSDLDILRLLHFLWRMLPCDLPLLRHGCCVHLSNAPNIRL